MTFLWTEERILEAIRLQQTGWTTYQIAAHFRVSRNAVCGKLFREKARRGLTTPVSRPRKPSPADKRKRKEPMLTVPERASFVFPPVSLPAVVPDEGRYASIVDVTGCKWPVKEDASFVGGHAFCNAETGGKVYCEHHRQINVAPYSAKLIRKTLGSLGFRIGRRIAA